MSQYFLVSEEEHKAFLELSQDTNESHVGGRKRNILQGVHSILRLFHYMSDSFFSEGNTWDVTFRSPLYTDTVYRLSVTDTSIKLLDVETECLVINIVNDQPQLRAGGFQPLFRDSDRSSLEFSWSNLAIASGGRATDPRYLRLVQALVPITTFSGSVYPGGDRSAILKLYLTWRANGEATPIAFKKSGKLVAFRAGAPMCDVEVLCTAGAPMPSSTGCASLNNTPPGSGPMVLVIGGTGVVGSGVSRILTERHVRHVTTSRRDVEGGDTGIRHHRRLDLTSDRDLVDILTEFEAIQVICFIPTYPIRPEPQDLFDVQLLERYLEVYLFGAMRVARVCKLFKVPHLLSVESSFQEISPCSEKYKSFSAYIAAKKIASSVITGAIDPCFTPMWFHSALPPVGSENYNGELRLFTEHIIELVS